MKPIIKEAFEWTGGPDQEEEPDWAVDAVRKGIIFFEYIGTPQLKLKIKTLEGTMTADRGDWIIQGVNGEIYPCKPDVFHKTYELAEIAVKKDV